MRRLAAVMMVVMSAMALAEEGDVKLKNGVVVPPPGKGYVWQRKEAPPAEDVGPIEVVMATRDQEVANVVLVMDGHREETDRQKALRIRGTYRGIAASLKQQGFKEINEPKLPVEPPVGERVAYGFSAKTPDDRRVYFESRLIFGKSTYLLTASAESEAQAKELAKVAERVKE